MPHFIDFTCCLQHKSVYRDNDQRKKNVLYFIESLMQLLLFLFLLLLLLPMLQLRSITWLKINGRYGTQKRMEILPPSEFILHRCATTNAVLNFNGSPCQSVILCESCDVAIFLLFHSRKYFEIICFYCACIAAASRVVLLKLGDPLLYPVVI